MRIFTWMRREWVFKLLALVFSLMACTFIYSEPGRIITSEIALQTSVANLTDQLVITNEIPQFVLITIQGAQGRINSINNARGLCVLDLRQYTKPGIYTVPLKISKLTQMSILRAPDPIVVQLEPVLVRSIEVKLIKKETLPEGIRITKETFEPTTVKITGPEEKVASIENVWAMLDLSQITGDLTDTIPLVPYSASLKPIDNKRITIDPPQIKLKVNVTTAGHYIRVEVLPNIKDNRRRKTNITIKPSHVVIPRERFKEGVPEFVLTEPIDITENTTEYTAMVPVIYPFENKAGLKTLVQVTVSFGESSKERNHEVETINWNVQFINLGEGLQAELTPPNVKLTPASASTPLPQQLYIDLANKGPGKYKVKIFADPSNITPNWQLSHDYIDVEIIDIQE